MIFSARTLAFAPDGAPSHSRPVSEGESDGRVYRASPFSDDELRGRSHASLRAPSARRKDRR